MRPVVNTNKHYVQASLFTIASGAVRNDIIVQALDVPAAVTQVRVGSIVSAIYVEMWLTSDDAALGSVVVTLEKVPGSSSPPNATDMGALGLYDNKKNVLHTQMGLISPNVQYPVAAIKGWFKIPKGKRRMGFEDTIRLNIFAQSNGVTGCGFFTYKEQY